MAVFGFYEASAAVAFIAAALYAARPKCMPHPKLALYMEALGASAGRTVSRSLTRAL